jgi:monoamine oxidase
MSEPIRSKIRAVAKKPATSTPNTSDVGVRPIAEAAAKFATKKSSQPPTDQHAERTLERLTNNFDGRRAQQSKSSPPPAKFRKVFEQPFCAEGSPQRVSTIDKHQVFAQPSFVKQHENASLLFDNYESPDQMARSAQSLLSGTSIIGKPVFKRPNPQPSSASSPQPAAAPTTQQALNNDTSKVSSSQCRST